MARASRKTRGKGTPRNSQPAGRPSFAMQSRRPRARRSPLLMLKLRSRVIHTTCGGTRGSANLPFMSGSRQNIWRDSFVADGEMNAPLMRPFHPTVVRGLRETVNGRIPISSGNILFKIDTHYYQKVFLCRLRI